MGSVQAVNGAEIRLSASRDSGVSWSAETTVASTAGASDHPFLLARGGIAYVVWHTLDEGLRILPVSDRRHRQV